KPESREKFENFLLIEPSFKLKSDLHISSGDKTLVSESGKYSILLLHHRNSEGFPVIPGSSFKGAVSTNFLALTGKAEMTANLFGATRNKAVISKVFFSDLKPEKKELKKVEVLWQWKPNISKDRHVKFYTQRAPRTKRYGLLECIPSGSVVKGKLVAYNLNEIELGGLLVSMGFGIENAVFKISYGKPQGFGQMQPSEVKIYEIKFEAFELKKEARDARDSIEKFKKEFGDRISKYGKKIFAGV
ncbi:MAG: RAMP superfamily CRISPR-associated protein, partial [Archaeoglobaceae archaeon]